MFFRLFDGANAERRTGRRGLYDAASRDGGEEEACCGGQRGEGEGEREKTSSILIGNSAVFSSGPSGRFFECPP